MRSCRNTTNPHFPRICVSSLPSPGHRPQTASRVRADPLIEDLRNYLMDNGSMDNVSLSRLIQLRSNLDFYIPKLMQEQQYIKAREAVFLQKNIAAEIEDRQNEQRTERKRESCLQPLKINKNSKNKSEEVSKSPQNNIQTYFEEDWNETLGQYYNQTPRTIADMKRKEKFLIDKGEYREANALHTEIIKTEMIYQKKRDQMYLKTKSKYVTELKSDKNQINQNREKQRAILEQTVAKMQNKDQQQRRSGPNQVFSRLFLPSLNQDKNSSSPNKPTSTTFRTQVNPETINFTNNSGNVDANVQTNENIQQNENDIVENEAKDQLENDNTKTEDPTKVDDKNKENVNKDSTPGNQESKLNNDPLKAVGEQMVQKMAGEEAIDDKEAGKLINKNDQEADKKLKKKTVVLDPKMINGAKIDDVPSTSNLPVVRVDLASAKDDENGIFSSWMSVDTCNQKPLRLEPVLGVDFPDDDDERASSEDTMDDPLAAILSPLASLEVMQTLDNNAEPILIDSKAKASKKTEENSKNETKTKKKRKRKI